MDDFNVDKNFIMESLASFTPQERSKFEKYRQRLLRSGFLMLEEAEEAACHRVINERDHDD